MHGLRTPRLRPLGLASKMFAAASARKLQAGALAQQLWERLHWHKNVGALQLYMQADTCTCTLPQGLLILKLLYLYRLLTMVFWDVVVV